MRVTEARGTALWSRTRIASRPVKVVAPGGDARLRFGAPKQLARPSTRDAGDATMSVAMIAEPAGSVWRR